MQQHDSPHLPHKKTSLWGRLPFMGKMLVLFWGGILTIGAVLALAIHHFTPAPSLQSEQRPAPHLTTPPPLPPAPHAAPQTAAPQKPVPTPSPLEIAAHTQRVPLAILFTGYGYGTQLSQDALHALPASVALGISPYLEELPDSIAQARAGQHELYMSLPMRSIDPGHTDTGSQTLGTGESPAHEQKKLGWWLSRAQGITGMTDITGSGCNQTDNTYLQSQEFHDIAQTITRHGLLYLNGQASSERPTRGITATQCLNGDSSPEDFTQSLKSLGASALPHEAIMLVITPITPAALHSLTVWLQSPSAQHFYLMPPSALADTPPLSLH